MAGEKPRPPAIDLEEVRRRRALEEQRRYPSALSRDPEPDPGAEDIHFGWKDILAMIIAAYQILLPMLAAIIGALLVVYFLFRFLFH